MATNEDSEAFFNKSQNLLANDTDANKIKKLRDGVLSTIHHSPANRALLDRRIKRLRINKTIIQTQKYYGRPIDFADPAEREKCCPYANFTGRKILDHRSVSVDQMKSALAGTHNFRKFKVTHDGPYKKPKKAEAPEFSEPPPPPSSPPPEEVMAEQAPPPPLPSLPTRPVVSNTKQSGVLSQTQQQDQPPNQQLLVQSEQRRLQDQYSGQKESHSPNNSHENQHSNGQHQYQGYSDSQGRYHEFGYDQENRQTAHNGNFHQQQSLQITRNLAFPHGQLSYGLYPQDNHHQQLQSFSQYYNQQAQGYQANLRYPGNQGSPYFAQQGPQGNKRGYNSGQLRYYNGLNNRYYLNYDQNNDLDSKDIDY